MPDVHKFFKRSQSQPPDLHKLALMALQTSSHMEGGEGQEAKRDEMKHVPQTPKKRDCLNKFPLS